VLYSQDELGRACSTHGVRGIRIGFWSESEKKRNYYENLDVDGRLILRCILEKKI
jgi:hypothetical protein